MKKFLSVLIVLFSVSLYAQETQTTQPRSTTEIMRDLRVNIESQKELIGKKDSIIASNLATISDLQVNAERLAADLTESIENEKQQNEKIVKQNEKIVKQNEKLKLQRKWLLILSSILGAFFVGHIILLLLKAKWNITIPYWLNTIL